LASKWRGRRGGRAAQWEQVVVTQNRWSWAALVREKATGRGDKTKGASIKCSLAFPEVPLGVFGIGVGIVKYGSLGGKMVTYLKIGYHTSFRVCCWACFSSSKIPIFWYLNILSRYWYSLGDALHMESLKNKIDKRSFLFITLLIQRIIGLVVCNLSHQDMQYILKWRI
jgi:hypothetical protein